MNHTLNLTLGAKTLARSIISLPDQFKTPSEVVRAAKLFDLLKTDVGAETTAEQLDSPIVVEVTEAQRDLLKQAVTTNSAKLPMGSHALTLLEQLGFTE